MVERLDVATAAPDVRRPLPGWRFPVVAWAVWRAVLTGAVLVLHGAPLGMRFQGDGGWYRIILDDGYRRIPDQAQQPTAFFPLLPWTARAVRVVVRSDVAAVLIVTLVASLLAVLLLHAVVREWRGDAVARAAVVALLVFPTSFYLAAFYTEALFVALSAGALLAQQRGRPVLAGLLAFGVTMTRIPGLLLVPVLVLAHRKQHGRLDRRAWWYCLGLLGLVPVIVAQQAQFGDGLAFLSAGEHWGRHLGVPVVPVARAVRQLYRGDSSWGGYQDLAAVAVGGVLCLLAFRRRWPWAARAWLGLQYLIPLFSNALLSMGRYLLGAWPGFAVAGEEALRLSRPARVALVAASVVGWFVLVVLWSRNHLLG